MILPSVFVILVLISFILVLIHAVNGKIPLWIPVLLMCVAMMVGSLK